MWYSAIVLMWEITAATANKGHSLLRNWPGKLGIMPEQIMVSWGTMNDRTMFEAAGPGSGYGKCR